MSPWSVNYCKFRGSGIQPDPPQFQGPILYSCTCGAVWQLWQEAAVLHYVRKVSTDPIIHQQRWLPLICHNNLSFSEAVTASSSPCSFPKRSWITMSKDTAPSSWVNDPQFSNTEQALQRSTKGLGLGTPFSEVAYSGKHPPIVLRHHAGLLRTPLGAITHPPSPLYTPRVSLKVSQLLWS